MIFIAFYIHQCYVFTFTCNLLAQMRVDLFPLHIKLVHSFSV